MPSPKARIALADLSCLKPPVLHLLTEYANPTHRKQIPLTTLLILIMVLMNTAITYHDILKWCMRHHWVARKAILPAVHFQLDNDRLQQAMLKALRILDWRVAPAERLRENARTTYSTTTLDRAYNLLEPCFEGSARSILELQEPKAIFNLLDLLPELQVLIYKQVFQFAPSGISEHYTSDLTPVLPLLQVNKEIKQIAEPLFYQINRFHFYGIPHLIDCINGLRACAPHRLQHLRHLSVDIVGPTEVNFHDLLQMHQLKLEYLTVAIWCLGTNAIQGLHVLRTFPNLKALHFEGDCKSVARDVAQTGVTKCVTWNGTEIQLVEQKGN